MGASCFSRGAELQFSEKACAPKWALALGISQPTLKRMIKVEAFFGALKRSFPRMNAGLPPMAELMAAMC